MQNRHFDIAGPNPSPEELKQIDYEYTAYLDVQRRNAIAAALAKKQSEQIQADSEKAQQPTGSTSSVGPPMVITPTNLPATGAKESVDRSRDSLAPVAGKLVGVITIGGPTLEVDPVGC